MKIAFEQLEADLARRLASVYLVSGDEPLQTMEASDAIRRTARSKGYLNREIFHVESSFDWNLFREAADSFSMFDEQKVLDLRFSSKPDKAAASALSAYATRPSPDSLLLLTLPKLSLKEQGENWFLALDKMGVFIQVWPIQSDKILRWLDRRLNARGLLADDSGLHLLAARVEGNMLAAAQEVEKLHILYGSGRLTDEQILKSVADNARYDIFDLGEAVVKGEAARSCRIIRALAAEGIAAPVVLWVLTRETRLLIQLANMTKTGTGLEDAFLQLRIKDKNRKLHYAAALRRLELKNLHLALLSASRTDRMIKGLVKGDAWDSLVKLAMLIATGKARLLQIDNSTL